MEIDFGTIPILVSLAVALFVIYIVMYYKFIYSIIDPLFVFVFTTAFASVLAIEVIPTTSDVLHFFGCQLALWLGFFVAYRRAANKQVISNENQQFNFSEYLLLRYTTYLLLGIYILSNIIIGYVKGFALLSDEPTVSKIANFQQGFGLFRKINWSTGTFTFTALLFLYLVKKKIMDIFLLIIVVFLTGLEGSKSAFLQIAISSGIVIYHPVFSQQRVLIKKFQRFVPFLGLATISVFFLILLKENDGYDETFFAFIRRLLYSADSILYYYQPVNVAHFESYSFGDYISRLINPILGFFRLQDYVEAPGLIMVDNLRSPGSNIDTIVGPNAPFYIEGKIYFNFWTAFLYCFLVGYTYAKLRVYYFSIVRSSAFYFVYMGSLLRLAGALVIDVNLAVAQLFDLAFFVLLPFIGISFLLTHRLKIRKHSTLLKSFVRS